MGKGGAGTVILVLIILIAVGLVAYYFLFANPPNPDGGGNQTTPKNYKNDVITVDSISVSNPEPYSGGITTISFNVNNNGEFPTEVEVNFFDIGGFTPEKLYCEDIQVPTGAMNCGAGQCVCDFSGDNSIDSLSSKEVSITLQVPEVISESSYLINYYIKYNYSGYRVLNIPIIDGTTRKTPLGQYSQSDSTYGPVQLEFEPPVGSETTINVNTITEYFGKQTEPFFVKMKFTHVGSSSIGNIMPVNMSSNLVNLNITNMEISTVGSSSATCDFNIGSNPHNPKKSFIVPKELSCYFTNSTGSEPEVQGSIYAEYNYTYQYTRSESIDVKLLPSES